MRCLPHKPASQGGLHAAWGTVTRCTLADSECSGGSYCDASLRGAPEASGLQRTQPHRLCGTVDRPSGSRESLPQRAASYHARRHNHRRICAQRTGEKQGISTLCCVEFDIDEDEALRRILNHHRRSSGWNDYNRIRMASELRAVVRTRARANQQTGGQFKGLSKLAKANRISVREEIANAAGVSEGSVTKVDQLRNVNLKVLNTLRSGEIRIHRAWNWRLLPPEQQREQLRLYWLKRDLGRKVRTLISKHKVQTPDSPLTVGDLDYVSKRLSALPARSRRRLSRSALMWKRYRQAVCFF